MLNMNSMRGPVIALMAIAGIATASDAHAAKREDKVGGSYGVMRFEGLPARNGYEEVPGAKWTPTEFLDLKDLDTSCHRQMDPQIPGIMSDLVLPTAKMVVVGGIAGGLGAVAAFTGVSFMDYAKYAGISLFGTGALSYSDRRKLAKNYVQYACMQFVTSEARRNGRLKGIGIIPNAFASKMKGVSMPSGPASRGDVDSTSAKPGEDHAEDDSAVPPGGL